MAGDGTGVMSHAPRRDAPREVTDDLSEKEWDALEGLTPPQRAKAMAVATKARDRGDAPPMSLSLKGDAVTITYTHHDVTSRKVVRLFLEQFRLEFVPVFHRLQWRLAAQC